SSGPPPSMLNGRTAIAALPADARGGPSSHQPPTATASSNATTTGHARRGAPSRPGAGARGRASPGDDGGGATDCAARPGTAPAGVAGAPEAEISAPPGGVEISSSTDPGTCTSGTHMKR